MLRDPKDCYDHAKRCRELVRETDIPPLRKTFLDLARTWERLAAELKAANKLTDQSDEVPKRRAG
jgi:hypothetical protein